MNSSMHRLTKLWKCPKCGRQFERQEQSYSCKSFPAELHFKGKPQGRLLYEKLKRAVRSQIGSFKIESLECCIHFVSTFTFAAVKIFKDKIQIDFALNRILKNKRIDRFLQLSANRYLYYFDINEADEIDNELIEWIQEAHDKKREEAKAV
jgi:uncharacterized C2H2 Zn-finger protein